MTTATLIPAPSIASRPDNRAALWAQHKAEIIAGGDGLESGRKLGLLLAEVRASAATFARRKQWSRQLREDLPRLQAAARDADKRSQRLMGMAERNFAATTSAKWLVELGLPADATLQDLAQGIVRHLADRLKSKQEAQNAALLVASLRDQATADLRSTASLALHNRLHAARNKMLLTAKKIEASDRWVAEIDARVARCRRRCERLFRGERDDANDRQTLLFDAGPSPADTMRRRYEAAKAELQKLLAEAATRPQVLADRARNANDQAAFLAERDQILAAMLLPENMRFHGESA
jgi:hypothetical protein